MNHSYIAMWKATLWKMSPIGQWHIATTCVRELSIKGWKKSLTCGNPHSKKTNHSCVAMWKVTLWKVSPIRQWHMTTTSYVVLVILQVREAKNNDFKL